MSRHCRILAGLAAFLCLLYLVFGNERTGFILLVLASGITLFMVSGRAALSLALGGVLSIVNFHWLKQAVDYVILEGGSGPVGKRVAWQYAGRYALIAITLYVTI